MKCPAVDADGVLKTSSLVYAYLKTVCNPQVHCVIHCDLWELFLYSKFPALFHTLSPAQGPLEDHPSRHLFIELQCKTNSIFSSKSILF